LVYQFDYANDPENIVIDLGKAQVYDSSTIAALDGIITKYENKGKKVTLEGIDIHSQRWHDLSGRLGAGH
jgi:SulP family sulfate permease